MLALLSFCFFASAAFCEVNYVKELTPDDFKEHIKSSTNVLVKFYAPWCGHCKRLAPTFEEAAKRLALEYSDISAKLAKFDCDKHADFCSKYSVTGYPTLKVFKKGDVDKPDDYTQGRSEDDLLEFMVGISQPESTEIDSTSKYDAFVDKAIPVVVAYIKPADKFFDEYKTLADGLRGKVAFGHSNSASHLGFADDITRIKVVRPRRLNSKFEESEMVYNGKLNAADLKKWIYANGYGQVGYRTSSNADFFEAPVSISLYHGATIEEDASTVRYYRNRLASGYQKAGITDLDVKISYSPSSKFQHEWFNFGINAEDFPAVVIQSESKKYILRDFTKEKFVVFIQEFNSGILKPYIKSKPVPGKQENSVKEVVALNFDEVVNDKTKDVLVMYYSPSCGHCKELEPKFEKAATALSAEKDIILAKFDATGNELPQDTKVNGYPTVIFYPKNGKPTMNYEGSRTVDDIIKFIAAESADELEGYDRLGKKKRSEL